MKRLASLLLALSSCSAAFAAPASNESIERLLVLTRAESLLDGSYANVDRMFRQGFAQGLGGRPLTADEQQRVDAMSVRVMALMKDEMSWARIEPEYVRLYAQTFDQNEVDGLIAFYMSPPGQAMVAKMPLLMQNTMAMMQAQMAALMPKMMAVVQDTMKGPPPK